MNKISRDLKLEQQIDAYIKGRLTDEEAQDLWEKLLQRPDYIELLETELGIKSILEKRAAASDHDTAANEQGIVYSLQRYWKWMAAAAAVAIMVAAINILQIDTNQSSSDLSVGDINLAENLSSAQIMRAQKGEITPADSLLNHGFEAAISGEVSEAIKTYDEIIEKYGDEPAAVQAYLNKGIIQYNSGSFKESISSFKSVLNNVRQKPIIKEKAYWYLGNAYINIDDLPQAREAIHSVYAMDGIYRKSAFRLLRKLDYELGNVDYDDFDQQMKNQ